MRKLIALATLSVVTVVGVAAAMAPAGAAEAAAATGVIKQPTSAYSSPSKTTATVQLLDQGDTVDVLCYTEGQRVNDNPYWFRVDTGANSGYVHRDAIAPSTTDLSHC